MAKGTRKEGRTGRRSEPGRLRSWFSSLNRAVQWLVAAVITAGALATAIAAIISLWPDSPEPPPELAAELSEVLIDENVSLGEYQLRSAEQEGSSAPSAEADARLAVVVAQTGTVKGAGTTTTAPTVTETTPTQTETTPTQTETDESDGDEGMVVEPDLSEEAEERFSQGVRQALESPALGSIDIGQACADRPHGEECGLSGLSTYMGLLNQEELSEGQVADRLVNVLTGTRTTRLQSGRTQPVGVTVFYRVSLTGFRGRTVEVRWSLFRPGGALLPHEWLRDQRAALLRGEADKDSASPSFWAPLPALDGPFFIRIVVENENGLTLARRNTPRFG
jgi:uncharacterized protein YciW